MGAEEGDNLRHKVARAGDHTARMFQCDYCQFQNLKGREPGVNSSDELLMICIRRANLDAFWARETGTIRNHVSSVSRQLRHGELVGLDMYPPLGPYKLGDPGE